MPTYIDESGDTGLVINGGKPYFRLAAVWTPNDDVVRSFQNALAGLWSRFNLKSNYEFKFAKTTHPDIKSAFFDLALAWEFRFAFSQVDKTADYWRNANGDEQYWSCATDLAVALRPLYIRQEESRGEPLRERVVVDNNDSPRFLNAIRGQFMGLKSPHYESRSLVTRPDFRKSHKEPWLQLADMICGAVGSWTDGEDLRSYEQLKGRRIDELSHR